MQGKNGFKWRNILIVSVLTMGVTRMAHGQVGNPMPYSSSTRVNYFRTWDAKAPIQSSDTLRRKGVTDVIQSTQYVDGLGRPFQTVSKQMSPAQNDLISKLTVYDPFGREQYSYLPSPSQFYQSGDITNDGDFKFSPFQQDSLFSKGQYPGETYYYSQVNYESSPLNRPAISYSQGNNWVGSSRGIGVQYLANAANDSVQIWTIGSVPGSKPANAGSYPAARLNKAVTTDEQNHQVVEYKDWEGHVVLKKVQLADVPGTAHVGWLNTYYVYDSLDNLRFVIQPKAVQWLQGNIWSFGGSTGDSVSRELCFRYEYDFRNRMIVKQVPGAGEVWVIYDTQDRLVFTQDSALRKQHQWLGTQYDGLNRPVTTGLLMDSASRSQLQTLVTSQTSVSSTTSLTTASAASLPANLTFSSSPATGNWQATSSINLASGFGVQSGSTFGAVITTGGSGSNTVQVNNSALPSGYTFNTLTVTFYDDYSWVSGTNSALSGTLDGTNTTNSNDFITNYNASPVYATPIVQNPNARGFVTGNMSLVLGSSNQFLYAADFYDDQNRMVQTQSINYTQGKDVATTQYSFSGKPLRTLLIYEKMGNTLESHSVLTKLIYDQALRVKSIYKNIDGAPSDQLIDSLQYNELGQLRTKYIGSSPVAGTSLDSLVYDYNIRGWVTGINKNYLASTSSTPLNYFGMELGYDKTSSVTGTTSYANPVYNGNIAGTIWKSAGDGVGRKYDFSYDNVNRLTGAVFVQNTSGSGWDNSYINYSTSGLTYDANGNILAMNQRGFKVGGSVVIDSLTYTYQNNSNKLWQVADAANDSLSKLGDFHYRGSKQSYDYAYDGNGSLSLDNNKTIDNITYNHLNLPSLVHMSGKGNIAYTYDASGTKIKKVTADSLSRHSTTTLYLGNFVYQQTDTIISPGAGIDTLQFMVHEEGRARWAFHKYVNGGTVYGWEYDFFEKDHLGNTRVALTQEKDTALYLATMEAAYRNTENALFYNLNTCYPRASAMGYPVDYSVTNPNDSVIRVNGNGPKVGPAIILKVMSGDVVDVSTQYYYNSTGTGGGNLTSSDLLNVLASGLVSVSGGIHGSFADLTGGSSPLPGALTSFVSSNNPSQGATKPQAFINWILFDNQFKSVSTFPQTGAVPVGSAGTASGGVLQPPIGRTGIPITKSGYLYIYVSNATPGWDVFFDNLTVRTYSGPMLEENHYYPFGLTMAGISDKVLKGLYAENKNRYNQGAELQNKEFSDGAGLEMYDTHFRQLDPQLGRWWQIDPKPGDMISIYASMENNPILFTDKMGDIIDPDEASKERFEKLKRQNLGNIQGLLGKIISTVMSGGNISSKAFKNQLNLLNRNIAFRDQLSTLEKSDVVYHISSESPGLDMHGKPLAGKTDYNSKTKQVDIKIGGGGIDVLAHELRHGYGFEIGEIAFGEGKILTDLQDEIVGEETGYLFRSSGWQDFVLAGNVTADYMKRKGYSDIPEQSLTLDSKGSEITKATGDRFYSYYPDASAREIFQKRNELLVKSGNQPLFIYNDMLRVKKK